MDAYSNLLKKYSNVVYAVALSIVHDFHSAEDLAQETFVKAWFHLNKLEDGNKFGAWVCSIARRLCLDWLRKSKDFQIDSVDNYLNVTDSHTKKELIAVMQEAFEEKKIGQDFHDDVMWRIVPRIATIEIPVSNLKKSIEWYSRNLGTRVVHETTTNAMLHLQGSNKIGVPTLFLCQTDDVSNKLAFLNTNIRHSVIDFYVPDLVRFHKFLSDQGVNVGKLNYNIGEGLGGFGFSDPDENIFSACNIIHHGQV